MHKFKILLMGPCICIKWGKLSYFLMHIHAWYSLYTVQLCSLGHPLIFCAGRWRGCHPKPDGSFVSLWISARSINEPSSNWAAAHWHSSHFRFEMVKKIGVGHITVHITVCFPHVDYFEWNSGATCHCQGRQCWEWQLPLESSSCTRCQTGR